MEDLKVLTLRELAKAKAIREIREQMERELKEAK